MKIRFNATYWREIMQKAKMIISPYKDPKHPVLQYILMVCENNYCESYVSDDNGATLCKTLIPCRMDDKNLRISFLVKPEKVPPKVDYVEVAISPRTSNADESILITYCFVKTDSVPISSEQKSSFRAEDYPGLGDLIQNSINEQKPEFSIAFYPDVLIKALSIYERSNKPVILHFGSHIQPLIIAEYGSDMQDLVLTCPVRIFNKNLNELKESYTK